MKDGLIKQAKARVMKYCAMAERSPNQVREKLLSFGLSEKETETIIDELKSERFVDEFRFARAFCHDKFVINHWGKIKIRNEIIRFGVSMEAISEGLEAIEEDRYRQVLEELITKKWKSLEPKELENLQRESRTVHFATGRGFEMGLVWQIVKQMSR